MRAAVKKGNSHFTFCFKGSFNVLDKRFFLLDEQQLKETSQKKIHLNVIILNFNFYSL